MLEVIVPAREYWDETLEQFTSQDERVLQLEHSLISISKWESKWRKPFLNDDDKSEEESRDYVRCMTMTKGIPPEVYYAILPEDILRISEYIKTPQTATTPPPVPLTGCRRGFSAFKGGWVSRRSCGPPAGLFNLGTPPVCAGGVFVLLYVYAIFIWRTL